MIVPKSFLVWFSKATHSRLYDNRIFSTIFCFFMYTQKWRRTVCSSQIRCFERICVGCGCHTRATKPVSVSCVCRGAEATCFFYLHSKMTQHRLFKSDTLFLTYLWLDGYKWYRVKAAIFSPILTVTEWVVRGLSLWLTASFSTPRNTERLTSTTTYSLYENSATCLCKPRCVCGGGGCDCDCDS